MSGGVDSTSVAAAATTLPEEPPSAYSAVFPGRRVDESERIDAVVDSLDLASVQAAVDPVGAFRSCARLPSTAGRYRERGGLLVEYPLLAEAAADGVTTVLDGQGGDELFALSGFLLADRVAHGRLVSSVRLTQRLPGARGRSPRQLFEGVALLRPGRSRPVPAACRAQAPPGAPRRRRRLAPPRRIALLVDTDHSLDWKRAADGPRWWTHKAYLLTRSRKYVRITDYLRERAAMAGLEAAPPLLDVDLVETALRIPPEIEFDPDTRPPADPAGHRRPPSGRRTIIGPQEQPRARSTWRRRGPRSRRRCGPSSPLPT